MPENSKTSLHGSAEPLARAVLSHALKLGLDRPQQEPARAVFDAEGRRAMRRAAAAIERGRPGPLSRAVSSLCRLSPPPLHRLEADYQRLFGHTVRGQVCPYECEYGRRAPLQQAQELADLAGFYQAFGLRSVKTRRERPDHVACELEFLEFLSLKECLAIERGDAETRDLTRQATRRFLRDHLARFGRAFAVSLQRSDPRGFYGAQGRLCEAFLALVCDRLRVPLGPGVLELRLAGPDRLPMACGPGDDLVEIGDRPL